MLTLMLVAVVGTLSGPGSGETAGFIEESGRLPPDVSAPGTSTTDVDLVDVDADGDLDLFLAEGTDSPAPRPNRLLLNDGAGTFRDVSSTHLPRSIQNSTKADFGDLDGDGDLDALVGNVGGEQLLLNDGSGVFSDASPSHLPPARPLEQDITADVRLADVDGDGDLDALLSNENPFDVSGGGGGQNRLWMNSGRGYFTDETSRRLPTAIDQTAAMLPGDIDGDGDLDVVVLNRGAEVVLVNDGRGHFRDETARRFPSTADSSRGGGLADMDGDGDLDVVVANSRGQPVALYLNQRGQFLARDFGMRPLAGETDTGLELVDLDLDGDLDVYVPNAGAFTSGHGFAGGQDRYFRNDGRGRFHERTEALFPTLLDPTTDAAFGDVDADGDLDVVVGNTGDKGQERLLIQR